MNDSVHCKFKNASPSRKTARGATALLAAALFTAAPFAGAATYDASTGYVTLLNGGAYGSDSPLTSNKVSKTNSATSELIDAWSDGLAPHSNTNYYAEVQFRTPPHSAGAVEFQGGRLVVKKLVLWKGFGDSTLTFPQGLEVAGGTLRCNESASSKANARARIYGPVAFTGNCTVNPSGGDALAECGLNFHGEASSPADVMVTVCQQQSPRWGWFGLLGGTDGFLGTVAVESCGYDMGTNGLPNGTVSFTGTNNVLRLLANGAAAAPVVKELRFDSAGPHEIRVAVDGADYGKIRVTNAFSASGPIAVSLSGTVSDSGNARRFEFLRVPGGSLAGVDLRLASPTAGDYTLFLSFEKDGSEDVVAIEAHKRVTMSANGAPGESPLNAAQVTSSGNLVNAWSDGNAPTDPTLCYYAINRQFRTPSLSSGEFAFAGGRFLMTKSTMWPKTFSPAVLGFSRGLEVMDQSIIRINDGGVKNVVIDGPVAFSGTSTIHPAGAADVESSGITLTGTTRSDADAEVVVQQYSAGQRGWFSLAGGTDGFLGKLTVNSCNYLMGTNGLPNGTLSFAGSGDVLRLPAVSSGMTPAVKALTFGDDGPATLEVVCDGADYGAVHVTGTISAERPLSVVLTGNVEQPEGGTSLLPVLRAPAGQLSLPSFSLAQDKIGSLAVEWFIEEEAGEQVLVAKVAVRSTVIIMR